MADVTDESGLREKIARVIRLTVRSNTYRDERGHTRMGLGLNGVDEATDQIMALISPAGEVERAILRKLANVPQPKGLPGALVDALADVNAFVAGLNAKSAAPRGMEG